MKTIISHGGISLVLWFSGKGKRKLTELRTQYCVALDFHAIWFTLYPNCPITEKMDAIRKSAKVFENLTESNIQNLSLHKFKQLKTKNIEHIKQNLQSIINLIGSSLKPEKRIVEKYIVNLQKTIQQIIQIYAEIEQTLQ